MSSDEIAHYIEIITKSSYFALISFTMGIIAIILAYIFFRRSQKKIHLSYDMSNNVLIENSISKYPRLSVLYDGDRLDNFTVSQITIKNLGNISLKSADIAPKNPLCITPDDHTKILEHRVVHEDNKATNTKINVGVDGALLVSFDYINPNDDIVFNILHTGVSSDAIKVSGSIIGETTPFSKKTVSKYVRFSKGFMLGMLRLTIDPKFGAVNYFV